MLRGGQNANQRRQPVKALRNWSVRPWPFGVGIVRNVGAQYVIWATGVIIPLILAPYVNRVLGPGGIGLVLFCQAFASYPTLVLEYGFQLGGARGVAARSGDQVALRRYVTSAWYARAALGAVAIPAALAIGLAFPEFRDIRVMAAMLLSAIVLGGSSEWYFRGCQRLGVSALWYVVGRGLTVPLTFLLVSEPGQFIRVLAIGVTGNAIPSIVLAVRMLREQPLLPPAWADIRDLLMEQRWFFLIMLTQSFGVSLTCILLMEMTSATETGYWAVAQRIQGPFWAVVSPFLTATFPRVVAAMQTDKTHGRLLARRLTVFSTVSASGMAIVLLLLSRPLLLLLAGPEFLPALPTLRLLCGFLPLIALTTSLVHVWLLPAGREEMSLYVTLFGSVVSVVVFLLTCRAAGHIAMAWALLSSEATKAVCYGWIAWREETSPRREKSRHETE